MTVKKKKVDVKCWSAEGMQRCLMILHPVCKTDAGKVLYTPMTVDVNAIAIAVIVIEKIE